jgi:BlaI family penicillinase repressor
MDRKLLDCEWVILRALWGRKPQSMGEIVANVKVDQPGIKWQYKTYHTYLRVMLEKGLIGCEQLSIRDKLYFPVVTREEAIESEGRSLVSRLTGDSVGRLVAMMAEKGQISQKDQQELAALFTRLNREGGERRNE